MKRDAREDLRFSAWVRGRSELGGYTGPEEVIWSENALKYWIRRAEALESLLLNNLDDLALHDFCPDHECGGGGCNSKDAEEAIDCRAWCWQKAIERCGEEQ